MDYKNLLFDVKNDIGIVRINRPETKNALTFDLLKQIRDVFIELRERDDIKIIVLTGYADDNSQYFSSGIDLNDLQQLNNHNYTKEELTEAITELQAALHAIEEVDKVVVADVRGFCFGSALEVALACDFIISTPETQFGLLETKYGIIPDLGGTFRLVRRIGFQYAKKVIMLAHRFDGDEAYRMGLIDWISSSEELENVKNSIIEQFKSNKFAAVIAAKSLIEKIHPIDRYEASLLEREMQLKLVQNPN